MNTIRASAGPGRHVRRLLPLVGAVALFAPLSLAGIASAATPPPAPTAQQRAEAIAAPSIVYVNVQWKGYVLRPSPLHVDGTLTTGGWVGPYTVTTACSGYVADSTGYVVTAGHCVNNASMTEGGKAAIINADIARLHSIFPVITPTELARVKAAIVATGRVEGSTSGAPPQRTVTVYPTGMGNANGVTASTVEFKSLDEGDVALLKVPKSPLPALAVAPSDPPTGTAIVLAGYAGSVASLADQPEPSFKAGETSSTQNIGGVPFTEVSAAATAGMSGGPALDMQGRVIGTISFKPGSEASSAFNFISATSTIRSLLSRNGVSNTLSAADQAYRTGLTNFFAGRYHKAVKSFDQVLAVEPQHARALKYKQQSIDNYPNDVESGGSNTMLIVGIAVGAVVLLAGAAAFVLLRRRQGPPTAAEVPIVAPAPTPVEPVAQTLVAPATIQAEPTPVEPAPPATEPVPSVEPVPAPAVVQVPAQAAAPDTGGFCPNCGTPHAVSAHFCESCGERFKVSAAAGRGRMNGHRR